jgi:hypothetical protein
VAYSHERKMAWQRDQRRRFAAEHGYSTASHYACGGNREEVLKRDGHACVKCGMTAEEHIKRWGKHRRITVDHKDKDRTNNTMDNLQTLCLSCHGQKDLIPELRVPQIPEQKDKIIHMREEGLTYQAIADATGFSIGSIYKWCKKWGIT